MPPPGTSISAPDPTPMAAPMHVLRGIAVSPGIAVGPIMVLDRRGIRLPPRKITAEAVERELERLDHGLEAAGREAEEAEGEARARLGPQYADILAAHARMIGDVTLRADTRTRVEHEQVSAEHAIIEVLEAHATRLERLSDSYLAARAADVRDIEARILGQLIGQRPKSFLDELPTPSLVLAQDLSPSETAGLDPNRVLGFATEAGGRASHTAIVAAALEIPAVVGLGKFLDIARQCRTAVIDGDEGLVILDPDLPTQARYRAAAAERSARFRVLSQQANLPAETLDSTQVQLWGNIEFTAEIDACVKLGAEGVGLFRTEFLFLNAKTPPSEDQQFQAYTAVIRALRGRPIVIRTLDLGADKLGLTGNRPISNPTRAWGYAACACRFATGVIPAPVAGDPAQHPGRRPDSFSARDHARRAARGTRHRARRGRRVRGRGTRRSRKPAGGDHGGSSGCRPDGRSPGEGGGLLFDRNQ